MRQQNNGRRRQNRGSNRRNFNGGNINGNINSAPGEPGGAIKKFFFPFNFSL